MPHAADSLSSQAKSSHESFRLSPVMINTHNQKAKETTHFRISFSNLLQECLSSRDKHIPARNWSHWQNRNDIKRK